ncbi:Zinc uptake transcriptional regulator, Fur family protein [Rhodospirillaceae bacterium LM-1]|nr:Zinc uptake transcriptional regulator, Fur family protein [Rhodospirillaceae bacterium LM-1]
MPQRQAFPKPSHDHERCIAKAMDAARQACASQGAQFTELRRQVLEIVWGSHAPIGAYEILSALTKNGRRPAPPTVYRALDFLLAHGLAHRIESKNAYVGCTHRHEDDRHSQFLICRACGQAVEVRDFALSQAIQQLAKNSGFAIEDQMVELAGLCPTCKGKDAHAS